jgi:membrane dipeptidase
VPRCVAVIVLIAACTSFVATGQTRSMSEEALREQALKIAREIVIVDTHIDLPYRLLKNPADVSIRAADGDFDYPRAIQGGLKVPFMSIYIPAEQDGKPGAKATADKLIDIVERLVKRFPDKFAIPRSVDDVKRQVKQGKLSLAMGMENGSGLGDALANVRYFFDRGIRYVTLAHAKSNAIADAAYDTKRPWKGLSPFGRKLVAEMNRVGIMVDVSHVSDSAARQAIRLSRAPVIASHSACRAFTPGWERNASDDLIRLIAARGGTIQIPLASSFLVDSIRTRVDDLWTAVSSYSREHHISTVSREALQFGREYRRQHGIPYARSVDIARHIDHVVRLVGIDYVGIGSDFDGVGDDLPEGVKDVSGYPRIIEELLRMGYTEPDIQKICAGNLLRVWTDVERVARELQAQH